MSSSITMDSSEISIDASSVLINGSPIGGVEVGTKASLLAKTGMTEGQQFYMNANLGTTFTSQENKLWTYTGRTWQVIGETIEVLANTAMIEGNTVEVSTDNDFEVKKTNTSGDTGVIGVVALQGASAGDWITVATSGLWGIACENDTYKRGDLIATDATDGFGKRTTSVSDQPFAKVLEHRTTTLPELL